MRIIINISIISIIISVISIISIIPIMLTSVLCTQPAIRAAAALICSRPTTAEAILLRKNYQDGDDNDDMLLIGSLDAYDCYVKESTLKLDCLRPFSNMHLRKKSQQSCKLPYSPSGSECCCTGCLCTQKHLQVHAVHLRDPVNKSSSLILAEQYASTVNADKLH